MAWPTLDRGTCRICGEPAYHRSSIYCEEHRDQAQGRRRSESGEGKGAASDTPNASDAAPELFPPTAETRPGSGSEPQSEVITPPSSLLGRLRGKATGPDGRPTTKERRPANPKRRVATADFWADATGGLAWAAAQAGHVPMARAISFTAPVTGDIVEDVSKDTWIDRAVQPIARNRGRYSKLFSVISLWVAVGGATAIPEREEQFRLLGSRAIRDLLPDIVKAAKAERQKEIEQTAALMDLMDLTDLGIEINPKDPIGSLWWIMFPPPAEAPPAATNGSAPANSDAARA